MHGDNNERLLIGAYEEDVMEADYHMLMNGGAGEELTARYQI